MPQFTSAAVSAQPDWVALGMVLVLAVFVAVMTVRKYLSNKKKAQAAAAAPAEETVSAPAAVSASVQAPAAPGSAGHVKIHDVPPKTAAMLMAITADKLGKPLNELRFISIKEVK